MKIRVAAIKSDIKFKNKSVLSETKQPGAQMETCPAEVSNPHEALDYSSHVEAFESEISLLHKNVNEIFSYPLKALL